MAINFFNPLRTKKNTPYKTPLDRLPFSAVEDISAFWKSPTDLQRINNRFLREPERYDEVRELGKGGNGKAILLRRRRDRSLLVVKIMNPFLGWTTATIAKEAFLLKHRLPQNDRIVLLTDYLQSAHVPQVQLYLEYCDGGDLHGLLECYRNHGRTLPESFAWHAFRQIAEGLAFIHQGYDHKLGPNQTLPNTWKKVIHADLKPENIFLRVPKTAGDYPDLVLADFGNSHTEADFHKAGTEIWLPPEKRYVSEWGDTWTMGAIISSFAWKGTPPPRFDAASPRADAATRRIFQRGVDNLGPPIRIQHQFGFPEPNRDSDTPRPELCDYERHAVFVRPMLMYSHELNDLVAYTSHPHFDHRLSSWDSLQIIWYEMEVSAADSHPVVPLMFGWEPPSPARVANDGESDATPEGRGNADHHDPNHRNSSDDSDDGGEDRPDQGGTRKRKRTEEDGDEDGHGGQDTPDQSESDKENANARHTSERGSTRKRRHIEDSDAGNRGVLGSSSRRPGGKRKHIEEGGDEESHDRQDSANRGRTMKRKHVEEGNDEEQHDGKDHSGRGFTKRRRRFEEDSDGKDRASLEL